MDELYTYRAAHVLYDAGDPLGALQELGPLLAGEEPAKSVLELAGLAFFRSAQLGRAEETFGRLVELDPTDAYARFALGRTLERQRRHDEAATCYRVAVAMDPREDYVQALDRVTGSR